MEFFYGLQCSLRPSMNLNEMNWSQFTIWFFCDYLGGRGKANTVYFREGGCVTSAHSSRQSFHMKKKKTLRASKILSQGYSVQKFKTIPCSFVCFSEKKKVSFTTSSGSIVLPNLDSNGRASRHNHTRAQCRRVIFFGPCRTDAL